MPQDQAELQNISKSHGRYLLTVVQARNWEVEMALSQVFVPDFIIVHQSRNSTSSNIHYKLHQAWHQSSPLQSSSGLVPVGPHDLMDCNSISSNMSGQKISTPTSPSTLPKLRKLQSWPDFTPSTGMR